MNLKLEEVPTNVNEAYADTVESVKSPVTENKDNPETSFNSAIYSSTVKKERRDFLNAFCIEEVWAEMERIKENKAKVDTFFRKTLNYQI